MCHPNVRKSWVSSRGSFPTTTEECRSRNNLGGISTNTPCLFSGDLKLVNGKKFTLVGTPQGHEIKDPHGICASIVLMC